jgi:hypothetical protein
LAGTTWRLCFRIADEGLTAGFEPAFLAVLAGILILLMSISWLIRRDHRVGDIIDALLAEHIKSFLTLFSWDVRSPRSIGRPSQL